MIYGACGSENCYDCRPLFDANNVEIPGTDHTEPIARRDLEGGE